MQQYLIDQRDRIDTLLPSLYRIQ